MVFLEIIWIELNKLSFISIFARLFLAVVLGGFIGIERGRRRHAAGFRTHILVCVGSALAMLTNQYVFEVISGGIGDPTRIGAQVISGIGFLGAGTIIVTGRQQIKGLTTAAGLWACAAMGLAIGVGFYMGAILGFIFIILSTQFLHKVDQHLYQNTKIISIYVELMDITYFKVLLSFIRSQEEYEIQETEFMKSELKDRTAIGVFMNIKNTKLIPNARVIEQLSSLDGILFLEEM